jgi:hypothetical protein
MNVYGKRKVLLFCNSFFHFFFSEKGKKEVVFYHENNFTFLIDENIDLTVLP